MFLLCIVYLYWSGTPLFRTPWGKSKCPERIGPNFSSFSTQAVIWDIFKCP